MIAANYTRPYEQGVWDCVMWPAAAAKAVIGKDFARGHRGKYNNLAKGYRHLQKMGFDSPEALVDSLLDEKPIGFAGIGDVVLCRTPSGDNLGVVIGGDALVVGEDESGEGLKRVPRKDWIKAWTMGAHHSGPVETAHD